MMTYVEELTVRIYTEIGVSPEWLLKPQVWPKARSQVLRLLASGLDPDDSIVQGMSVREATEVRLVARALLALKLKYSTGSNGP